MIVGFSDFVKKVAVLDRFSFSLLIDSGFSLLGRFRFWKKGLRKFVPVFSDQQLFGVQTSVFKCSIWHSF